MIEEMSSLEMAGWLSGASLSEKGVPQVASSQPGEQTVEFTHTLLVVACSVHVAHSCPVESFAMTRVSIL